MRAPQRDRAIGLDQAAYLRGLVRMDIRKQRKKVDRFAPKPGQDPAEAAEALARFRTKLKWAEETYRALGGNPSQIEDNHD